MSQDAAASNNNAANILHDFINKGQARLNADGTVELLNQQAMAEFQEITPKKTQSKRAQ